MANIAPSWTQVHPSLVEPGLIIQINQASGAFDTLAGGNPRVMLDSEDLYVYMRRVDIRTRIAAGQSAYNQLPSVATNFELASTATYLQRVRAEYDHHDTAQVSRWGTSIVEVQRLGMRQAHFQLLRSSLLYGMNPANGEGLLNAAGATAINLPPDSYGADTVLTYDNGQLAVFMLQQLVNLKSRTMQLGIPRKFVFLGPQRTLGQMEYPNIVQVTQFQRSGAGSETTKGVIEEIMKKNGDIMLWCYDDTLIGKGANGTDAVLLVMPEVEYPKVPGMPNTNAFAEVEPGIAACTLQYTDMAAPKEIPTPLAGGAIDVLSELRASPGWGVRPEAITIMSLQYM